MWNKVVFSATVKDVWVKPFWNSMSSQAAWFEVTRRDIANPVWNASTLQVTLPWGPLFCFQAVIKVCERSIVREKSFAKDHNKISLPPQFLASEPIDLESSALFIKQPYITKREQIWQFMPSFSLKKVIVLTDNNNAMSTGGNPFKQHQVWLAANILRLEKHACGIPQDYGRVRTWPQASSDTRHTLGFSHEQELISVRVRCRTMYPDTSHVRTWLGSRRQLRG